MPLNFIDLYILCIVTLIIQNKFATELFLWLHLPGELPDKSESFLIRLVCEMCHLFPAWKTITLHTYHQINPFNFERNHHPRYGEMGAFPMRNVYSKEYFLVHIVVRNTLFLEHILDNGCSKKYKTGYCRNCKSLQHHDLPRYCSTVNWGYFGHGSYFGQNLRYIHGHFDGN